MKERTRRPTREMTSEQPHDELEAQIDFIGSREPQQSPWGRRHEAEDTYDHHSYQTSLSRSDNINNIVSEASNIAVEDDFVFLCDDKDNDVDIEIKKNSNNIEFDSDSGSDFGEDMENDNFDKVTWSDDGQGGMAAQAPNGTFGGIQSGQGQPSETHNQRTMGDDIDNAGIGDGQLECEVGHPLKENDGTKDSYVSYQITTKVCYLMNARRLYMFEAD